MPERFTVLGGRGYLGSRLAGSLRQAGHDVVIPERDAPLPPASGHVIFAIGVASDFRTRALDTIRAHVVELERYLRGGGWTSFLYLSSTRVYAGAAGGHEDDPLAMQPADPDHLYNLSKATGESLCLTLDRPGLRVVRIANVYGQDEGTGTFIADVLRDARRGAVHFRTAAGSEKDYVALTDVLGLVPQIALHGKQRLYNLAAGRNVRVGEFAAALERIAGVRCTFEPGAPTITFPPIAIDRIVAEFGFRPQQLLDSLPEMLCAKESRAPMIGIDMRAREVVAEDGRRLPFASAEAFELISEVWVQAGWDVKYPYTFAWLGRPVIQLPEDLLRVQELIYTVKPDVILETGIAHGGSLVFYATLLKAMGRGRVIGIDVEIRPQNRAALEAHELRPMMELIEASSTDPQTIAQVRASIAPGERVLVILDSNHQRDHVLAELRAYAGLVPVGSYVIAADGIMRDVVGAPRSSPDWGVNNPVTAVDLFLREDDRFERHLPQRTFDESLGVGTNLTYLRDGWLRRVR